MSGAKTTLELFMEAVKSKKLGEANKLYGEDNDVVADSLKEFVKLGQVKNTKWVLENFKFDINHVYYDTDERDYRTKKTKKTLLYLAVETSNNVELIAYILAQFNIKADQECSTREIWKISRIEPVESFASTAAEIAKTIEIKTMIEQRVKVQAVIEDANTTYLTPMGIANLFYSYAHPPLFSWNWRSSGLQKVANKIHSRLNKEKPTLEECLKLIKAETQAS
jgi:hypothetical protein